MNFRKTALALIAVSPAFFAPIASASSESALLAAILQQNIQQLVVQQALNAATKAGFGDVVNVVEQATRQATTAQVNADIEARNQQILMDQQASTFCQDDQVAPTKIGRSVVQRTYSNQTKLYNEHNSPQAVSDPSRRNTKQNEKLIAQISDKCDPRVLPPVGKKDVAENANQGLACTESQIIAATQTATGRQVSPELPPALKDTDIGEEVRKRIDTYNSRMSAAEAGISSAMSEEKDTEIAAYQKLFVSPTIEEINAMSGNGGVGRDELVMMQIQSQMMLAMYKEMVEMRRLMAISVAQVEEKNHDNIRALTEAATR